MVEPIALHKPIEVLEPKPWEVALTQLRVLMKNVVVNHDRIRERVLELKDRYYDGQMGDGGTNWEKWAVGHFAYSLSYLRYLTSPHPLQMDKWEAQRRRAEAKAQKIAIEIDRQRSQAAWDQWREEAKQEQEDADKKAAKRLKENVQKRVRREAAKASAVSPNQTVIERLVIEYQALPATDKKIFRGLIGVEPIRKRTQNRSANGGKSGAEND